MKRVKFVLGLSLLLLLFIVFAHAYGTQAASSFKYKDYSLGKYVTYKGVIPTYEVDGIEADLSEQPSMISDRNIAYASVNGLFRDVLGAKTKYTKSKKRITITYNDHVLNMYIGQTKAEFDGEEIEAPCAPIRIKYKKGKIMANLVPTRFVCELFGMDYFWYEDTGTVSVNIPFSYEADGETIRYWGTKGKITFDGEDVELYGAPSLIISDTALINADSDLFGMSGVDYTFDDETEVITLNTEEHEVVYCLNSRIVYVDGLLQRCAVAPQMFYLPSIEEDIIYIPGRFTMENLGFYYFWNSETGTSEVYYEKPVDSSETGNVDEIDSSVSEEGNTDTISGNEESNTDTSSDSSNDISDTASTEQTGNNETEIAENQGNGSENVNTDNESDNAPDDSNDLSNADVNNENIEGSENNGNNEQPEETTVEKVLINVVNTVDGYKFFIDKDNCVQSLLLPVPENVKAGDFELRETLLSCITDLVIKGDYSEFYKNAEINNTGESILQIQIYYDPEADETIIKLLSDIVIGCGVSDVDDNTVLVRMDFVKNIYKKVIVIDAGHGDHDPGAQAEGYNESDLNLKVLLNCRELFKDSDVKVYYTRIDDSFLSLYDRAAFAELVGADMFIAIHHNSSWYTDVSGTSVYYGDKDTTTSLNGLTSEKLAWRMLENLTAALDTKVFGEGVINKNFVVVRDSKAPAVLLEIGFMSNHDELSRLVNDKFSKKVAKVIYNTVMDIYEEAD